MKLLNVITNLIVLSLLLVSTGFCQPPLILPMQPCKWQQHYNSPTVAFNLAKPLQVIPSGGLTEVFPTKAQNIRYNYLIAPQNHINITQYKYISMTVGVTVLSGTPVFEFLSP